MSPLQVTHPVTHAPTLARSHSLTLPIRLLPEPDCEHASMKFNPLHAAAYVNGSQRTLMYAEVLLTKVAGSVSAWMVNHGWARVCKSNIMFKKP